MEMEFTVFRRCTATHRCFCTDLLCESETTEQTDIRRSDHHSDKKGRQSENDNT